MTTFLRDVQRLRWEELTFGRKIGKGVQGTVFQGLYGDILEENVVAIKLFGTGSKFVLLQELEALVELQNVENVCQLVGYCEEEGAIVTRFYDGPTLKQFVDTASASEDVDARSFLTLLTRILHTVEEMMEQDWCHQDLHSRNILVVEDFQGSPTPVFIDFGFAEKVSPSGQTAPGCSSCRGVSLDDFLGLDVIIKDICLALDSTGAPIIDQVEKVFETVNLSSSDTVCLCKIKASVDKVMEGLAE